MCRVPKIVRINQTFVDHNGTDFTQRTQRYQLETPKRPIKNRGIIIVFLIVLNKVVISQKGQSQTF